MYLFMYFIYLLNLYLNLEGITESKPSFSMMWRAQRNKETNNKKRKHCSFRFGLWSSWRRQHLFWHCDRKSCVSLSLASLRAGSLWYPSERAAREAGIQTGLSAADTAELHRDISGSSSSPTLGQHRHFHPDWRESEGKPSSSPLLPPVIDSSRY